MNFVLKMTNFIIKGGISVQLASMDGGGGSGMVTEDDSAVPVLLEDDVLCYTTDSRHFCADVVSHVY